jgi:hypothetical protein
MVTASGVSISGNWIYGLAGIVAAANAHYLMCQENTIWPTGGHGIVGSSANHVLIASNMFLIAAAYRAIQLTSCTSVSIRGNNVTGIATAFGFYLDTCSRVVSANNTILAVGNAHYLLSCRQFSITGNVMETNALDAILIDANCEGGSIVGNQVASSVGRSVACAGQRVAINANQITDAGTYGLVLAITSDRCAAVGNIILDSATANMDNAGTNNVLEHNIIT